MLIIRHHRFMWADPITCSTNVAPWIFVLVFGPPVWMYAMAGLGPIPGTACAGALAVTVLLTSNLAETTRRARGRASAELEVSKIAAVGAEPDLHCIGEAQELLSFNEEMTRPAMDDITIRRSFFPARFPAIHVLPFLMLVSGFVRRAIDPTSVKDATSVIGALYVCAIWPALAPLIWERAYRISPGRLIVLRRVLGIGKWTELQSIPLEDAAVTCSFEEGTLRISRPEQQLNVRLSEFFRPIRLAAAIFRAAAESQRPSVP